MSKLISSEIALKTVLAHRPPKIELGVPGVAMRTHQSLKEQGSDFRISEVIRVQTGLNHIEEGDFNEQVELKTLEKLKEIQEDAYQEAYQLGLEDGKQEAFQAHSAIISEHLKSLEEATLALTTIKQELITQNERHLVQLAFHMAQRLAVHEISIQPDAIVSIVRQAVEMAQSEEKVTVQLHSNQIEALNLLAGHNHHDLDFLKKIQMEANDDLQPGSCIVISNYGEVDSRIEERVNQLWKGLEESLPSLKEKISAA